MALRPARASPARYHSSGRSRVRTHPAISCAHTGRTRPASAGPEIQMARVRQTVQSTPRGEKPDPTRSSPNAGSKHTVSLVLGIRSLPAPSHRLADVARFYGVSIDWLLMNPDARHPGREQNASTRQLPREESEPTGKSDSVPHDPRPNQPTYNRLLTNSAKRTGLRKFGDRARTARIAAELNQEAVADALGISVQSVRNWEAGRTEPNDASKEQMAELFEVSVNSLLRDNPDAERANPDSQTNRQPALNNAMLALETAAPHLSVESIKLITDYIRFIEQRKRFDGRS